jgi:hypothetical protein
VGYEGIAWPYAGTTTEPTSGANTEYSNDGNYVTATSGKAACDFNGIRNTAAVYVNTRTEKQWTASTVANNTYSISPATVCASRFKTVGTKSFLDVFSGITSNNINYGTSASPKENTGFWYLPGLGELCYLPSKRYDINDTIYALNQKYGTLLNMVGSGLSRDYYHPNYWSSSARGSNSNWEIDPYNNSMLYYGSRDSNSYNVRAFMRL